MTEVTDAEVGEIDLAVVAYRDEGDWSVAELPDRSLDTVDTIAKELRRYPGENGALALISVAEDFVLLVRAQGSLVRVLLSDATAATDWSLARSAIDHIGVHVDDEDDQAPAGDLAIVADMGMSAQDMGALLDDYDLYPEEILSEVADNVGLRRQVRRARRPERVSLLPGSAPMRAALVDARGARPTGGDVPIGAVVLSAAGEVVGSGQQRPRARRRPDRPRRGRRPARRQPRPSVSGGSPAAPWWSPSSRARCVPARRCSRGWTASSSGRTTRRPVPSGRSGTSSATAG